MKSRLVFLYVFSIVIIFVLAVLVLNFDVEPKEANNTKNDDENKETKIINFESNKKIELYRSKNDQIEELDLNTYLLCVVASEMPFKYEYEALRAQAIVARTYLFRKLNEGIEPIGDVCDNYAHCQAYSQIEDLKPIWKKEKGYTEDEIEEGIEKIKKAIVQTDGMVITYNNELINAVFHASSPEKTEDAKAIWSKNDVPYLKSVENVEDENYEYRESIKSVSYEKFNSALLENDYIDNDVSLDSFLNVKINSYTDSGRVKDVSIGDAIVSAEDLRTLFGINSTNFTIENNKSEIIFNVLGFGHGVGMSQVGADAYAKQGMSAEEIIHHYYTNVEIINLNE